MALTGADLALAALAARAGDAILTVRAGVISSEAKADGSPVTEADRRAEALILAGLPALWPGLPVIAEESAAAGAVLEAGRDFVLVDPLDGTREFISGRTEFTVNIARVCEGVPVLGVVHAPATGDFFLASEAGGAWAARAIPSGRPPDASDFSRIEACRPSDPCVAVVSLSHHDPQTESYLAELGNCVRRHIGSSLKFCLIACGEADIYPRFGPTMEWDTAAGDAVLRAAGGRMSTPEGLNFRYGKVAEGYRNGPFIARGRPS